MKFKLKYVDGTEKEHNLVTSWRELSVFQFLQLREWKGNDFLKLLSILTNIDRETLSESPQLDIDEKLVPFMKWIDTVPDFNSWSMPSTITIDKRKYNAPKDKGYFTFGQKIELQKKMISVTKETNNVLDCIGTALSIYYQPIINKSNFSPVEAEKMIPMMLNCKMEEAYPIASFFLKRSIASQNVIQPSLRLAWIKNKRAQGLLNWIFSKSSQRSTVLPEVTSLSTMKS